MLPVSAVGRFKKPSQRVVCEQLCADTFREISGEFFDRTSDEEIPRQPICVLPAAVASGRTAGSETVVVDIRRSVRVKAERDDIVLMSDLYIVVREMDVAMQKLEPVLRREFFREGIVFAADQHLPFAHPLYKFGRNNRRNNDLGS